MIIYNSDVAGFKEDLLRGILIEKLDRQVRDSYQQSGKAEIRSWENSLEHMHTVLAYSEIPQDAGVAIEYMIPSTSKRIDFLISGYDESDKSNVVIIELKQWDTVEEVNSPEELVKTYFKNGLSEVPHPSYQAWSYAQLLKDFNASVEDDMINLHPCAYLHNYRLKESKDPLLNDKFERYFTESPVFDKTGRLNLIKFLERYIKKGDRNKILYDIDNGRIRPSKSLQDRITSMLQGNPEFVMIDDQKVVYERALSMFNKSTRDKKKRVMIVEGGPGTGKSVVAVNLLAEYTKRNYIAQYISKNAAPRDVYKVKLKGSFKGSSIDNMFKSSGIYYRANENEIDVAIVDEAHRLQEQSGFYGNQGENQVKEIIQASKCSIFFVDDYQVISTKDIGKKEEIRKHAEAFGAEIIEESLLSQFRCNGSDGYLAWIDDVLQIRPTANKYFDMDYDFDVVETPQELLEWVSTNNQNNKSRILAGYCWEWPKKMRSDVDYHDIRIDEHDFGISWNLDEGIWAIDPTSVNAAGCIHTSQGLEFEYVGVIIGPDMYFEDGKVKTDFTKRAKSDQSTKGLKSLLKKDPERAMAKGDEIVRNTYRTLLTRAMKGTRVFCTDKSLAIYFKTRRYDKDKILEYVIGEDKSGLMVAEE